MTSTNLTQHPPKHFHHLKAEHQMPDTPVLHHNFQKSSSKPRLWKLQKNRSTQYGYTYDFLQSQA